MTPLRLSTKVVAGAALTLVYVVAGKLGLMLAFVHASATAVWPAIFLGAFIVNITTAGSVATSIGIAAGNTLEGVVGAYLVRRFAHGPHAFDRARDVFRFAVLRDRQPEGLGGLEIDHQLEFCGLLDGQV